MAIEYTLESLNSIRKYIFKESYIVRVNKWPLELGLNLEMTNRNIYADPETSSLSILIVPAHLCKDIELGSQYRGRQ